MNAHSSPASPDLLEAVVGAARRIVESRRARIPLDRMIERAAVRPPRGMEFRARLMRPGGVNVIAECKRRSPSRGVLVQDYDPAKLAELYERGGAAAISVLTEPTFFDGSLGDLEAVRSRVALPLLRKDFIVDPYQLYEACSSGADAVLLIVAALSGDALRQLLRTAESMGLAALVEVHDRSELETALQAGASIVGVNNRSLKTLSVDTTVCDELVASIPSSVVAVAESGLRSESDIVRMGAAGYSAVLVGEFLATHEDPAGVLRRIRQSTRPARAGADRP